MIKKDLGKFFVNQNVMFDIKNFHFLILWLWFVWSTLSLALTKWWSKKITLVDYDIVEEKNISNQFYNLENINKLKTESLLKNLEKENISTKINKLNLNLNDNKNLKFILKFIEKNLKISDEKFVLIIALDDLILRKKIYNEIKEINKLDKLSIIDIRTNQELVYIKSLFSYNLKNNYNNNCKEKYIKTIKNEIEKLTQEINEEEIDKEKICWVKNTYFYWQLISWLTLNNLKNYLFNKKSFKDIVFFFNEFYLYSKNEIKC